MTSPSRTQLILVSLPWLLEALSVGLYRETLTMKHLDFVIDEEHRWYYKPLLQKTEHGRRFGYVRITCITCITCERPNFDISELRNYNEMWGCS
jgi:hypothetical protein